MSNRWSFLLPAGLPTRFSLATLLIFMAVACVAIGQPHLTWAIVAGALYLLVGSAVIASGWRAKRYRLLVRSLTIVFGAAMLVIGVWTFLATLLG